MFPDSPAERVAAAFLEDVDAPPAPDAFELAKLAGLHPVAGDVARTSLDDDGTLYYSAARRLAGQQLAVARALAGFLLRRAQLEASRGAVADTASALLLPRADFLRASALTGWDLRALQLLYPNAAFSTLAARVGMLHESVVTWFEASRVRWRSPRCDELEKPTRFEQYLAEIAHETDTVLHPQRHVWAFPLRRSLGVVLICETQALRDRKD